MKKKKKTVGLITTSEEPKPTGLLRINSIRFRHRSRSRSRSNSGGSKIPPSKSPKLHQEPQNRHDNKRRQERIRPRRLVLEMLLNRILGIDKLIRLFLEPGMGKHVDANHERIGPDEGRADDDHFAFAEESQDESDDCQSSEEDDPAGGISNDSARLPAQDPKSQRIKCQRTQDRNPQLGTANQEQTTNDTNTNSNRQQECRIRDTSIRHADISQVPKEIESDEEHGDMEDAVSKEAEDEAG